MATDFLFATGCPRSGNTALTRLLNAHDEIVMGSERYKYLLYDGRFSELTPELYAPPRFFDFRETDTNITPEVQDGRFARQYEHARDRFERGTVRYVGDRIPVNPAGLEGIVTAFPAMKLIYIYRDIVRVASSWMARAQDDASPTSEDITVDDPFKVWSRSFETIDHVTDRLPPGNVFVLRYERLFNGDTAVCDALFNFLGLEVTKDVRKHFRNATKKWEDRLVQPLVLTPDQQADLESKVDINALARYDDRFETELAAYASA